MNTSRFEPWSLVNILHRDLDQIRARRFDQTNNEDGSHGVADWAPAVDIVEEKDRFVLRADLPGVIPEDIDINTDKGVLSLSGSRTSKTSEESERVQHLERFSGRFYRRFKLPETANAEDISATSANGILEIVIAKLPRASARRIAVQSA
ncbi:MAG: Hsp20/alpha crystallin family protein [Proteobacteria bacterium]|nr:Hsp20/alpha crystallin family protein [Pseudomonadota bacterium]